MNMSVVYSEEHTYMYAYLTEMRNTALRTVNYYTGLEERFINTNLYLVYQLRITLALPVLFKRYTCLSILF